MKRKSSVGIGILAMLLRLFPGYVFAAVPVYVQVVKPVPIPPPSLNIVAVKDGAVDEPVPNIYLSINFLANEQPSPMDSDAHAVLALDSCCLCGNQF